MEDITLFIAEVGFPIAAALGLGIFIWKLINRIIDGMETKLDVLDDKVADQISQMEDRLGTKLDSQHGILVALIDRIRSLDNEIIRQDTLIKTIQLVSIDNVIFETMTKRPFPRDKYIYEYTNAEFEKDFIQLDKIIVRGSLTAILLSLALMTYAVYFL